MGEARPGQDPATREARGERDRERLRFLEKAVESMSVGLTIATPEGRIAYVNRADAEMHGWDREELLGKPVTVYAPPGSPALAEAGTRRAWLRETLNVTRQGELIPVRLYSDTVRRPDGEIEAVVTLCEDVREEHRIQAALLRRERVDQALAVATEALLRGGVLAEVESDVLEGLRRATEVEHCFLTRLAGAERAAAAAGLDLALDQSLLQIGELSPSGHAWVGAATELRAELAERLAAAGIGSLAVVPVTVAKKPWGLLSLAASDSQREWTGIDVEALESAARVLGVAVENEQARSALVASEARYRDVVESASDLIQGVDRDGRLLFVNRAWADALGWSPREAVALSPWDSIAAGEHEHCREVVRRIFAGENLREVQTTFRTRDGRRLSVEGNLSLQLQEGQPAAILGIFRDVSERERLTRLKEEFIATVSHELRTPLTSILGALSLLSSQRLQDHPERQRELTDVALRNGERLLRMVNELLDVQRLEAGRLRLHLTAADVGEVLEDAAASIESLAESKSVRLSLASEPALVAHCDRERLAQVLFNLLSNAIKFSPDGEEVHATARSLGDLVEIEVIDRGPGIPAEFRRQLFERFAQADGSSTRRAGGSGLGLYISRRLIEAMGGRIRVEDRIGGGTRAVVTLAPAHALAEYPRTTSGRFRLDRP